MKKVLVLVQNGFEDTEMITTLNILKRSNIEYYLWSLEGLSEVSGKIGSYVETHLGLPQTLDEFNALFIPGGPAVDDLINYDEVIHLAKAFEEEGKVIGAICAAPSILVKAQVLEDRKFTAHPKVEDHKNLQRDKKVVVDRDIVTGQDFRSTPDFADAFVKAIESK